MFLTGRTPPRLTRYRLQNEAGSRRGAKLIVIDPRRTELAEEADYWVQIKSGTDIPFLNGLMHIIIKEGLEDKPFIEERTENYDALKETVAKYTPEYVSGTDRRAGGFPVRDRPPLRQH